MKTTAPKKLPERMTLATIDIGAHLARLLIAELNTRTREYNTLEALEKPVPLGSDVFRSGSIRDESIGILSEILSNFRLKMAEYGVRHYRAIAGSAVREAANADIFIERMAHNSGLDIRICSGGEEAQLNDTAVRELLPADCGFAAGNTLIADIGTGACQISAYRQGELRFTETLKIGTLRAVVGGRDGMAHSIDRSFRELNPLAEQLAAQLLIALGASVRTLLRLLPNKPRGHVTELRCDDIRQLGEKLTVLSDAELCERYALSPDEAETVHPCCLMLNNLLRMTGAERLLVPHSSTQAALMRRFIDELLGRPDRFTAQLRSLTAHTAERYRCHNETAALTAAWAETLFRRLSKLHGLPESALTPLLLAARLHQCGLYVNNRDYHRHSYYLLLNTGLAGIPAEAQQLAALAVLFHRKDTPGPLHPEYAALSAPRRRELNKIVALLRLSCALAALGAEPQRLRLRRQEGRLILHCGEARAAQPNGIAPQELDYFRSIFATQLILA